MKAADGVLGPSLQTDPIPAVVDIGGVSQQREDVCVLPLLFYLSNKMKTDNWRNMCKTRQRSEMRHSNFYAYLITQIQLMSYKSQEL